MYAGKGTIRGVTYTTLGLAAEAGEVANIVKKVLKVGGKEVNQEDMMDELGDALWYIALAGLELGLTLDRIAEYNLAKLQHRYGKEPQL